MGGFFHFGILVGKAYDNAGRVEIIIQSTTLSQEFRTEQNAIGVIACAELLGKAYGNSGLYDN